MFHPNIVMFLGTYTDAEKGRGIVTEYLEGGPLMSLDCSNTDRFSFAIHQSQSFA